MKLGLKALNRLIIVREQWSDKSLLEIQKAQISVTFHHNFVEFAVHVGDRAPRYGLSQSCSSFYCWEDDFFKYANTLLFHFQLCCLLAVNSEKKFRENLAWQSSLDLGGFIIYLFKIVFCNNSDQMLKALRIYLPSF